jgi:transitional endoplasmic reticulum ATPase
MNQDTIESLKQALLFSPDNEPLRLMLANALLTLHFYDDAQEHYEYLVAQNNNIEAKFGLANVFYQKSNYSACILVLEEILKQEPQNITFLQVYAKALYNENSIAKAVEVYKLIQNIDPSYIDDELDNQLKVTTSLTDDHYAYEIDPRFLTKPNINFDDIGGMDKIKSEIELKIIKPLQHQDLYKAYGKKIGGGILLYGPPGCGKTFIAKATSGQIKAQFINITLNDILDMWIGNSEKNLHEIFELARANKPCVIFIDEIDALGASRTDMKQSASRQLINQFLLELDGIDSNNDGILIIGATNTPWNLDTAFRRPGRFDRIVFVGPPDQKSRESIFKLKLANKPIADLDYKALAKHSEKYSGADIDACIDIAIENKLQTAFIDGIPKPIETKDIIQAIKQHKPSTLEWFTTAKNYALFANDSGLYDEILTYLKLKK